MDNVQNNGGQQQIPLHNHPQPYQALIDVLQLQTVDEGALFEVVLQLLDEGNSGKVESILQHVGGLRDHRGYNLFFACIADGKMGVVKIILSRKWAEALSDGKWQEGLHIAIRHSQKNMIPLLYQWCGINEKNEEGRTPLLEAIFHRKSELVMPLLEAGATPTIGCPIAVGGPVLSAPAYAVALGHTLCLDQLAKKVNLNTVHVNGLGNLLHVAIRSGQMASLRYLLTEHWSATKGLVEMRAGDEHQRTPLMLAAYVDQEEAIQLLHSKKALFDTKDANGKQAIHWAFLGQARNSIKVLWQLGADLDAMDNGHKRSVDYCLSKHKGLVALYTYLKGLDQVNRTALPLERLPPNAAVFRGGGPKGFAYVGAVEELERLDFVAKIRRVAGSSAGAINAGLMAVGCDSKRMKTLLGGPKDKEGKPMGFGALLDFKWKNKKVQGGMLRTALKGLRNPFGAIVDVFKAIWKTTGVCDGKVARTWIEGIIKEQTGVDHCTFKELAGLVEKKPKKFKHLHVFATRMGNSPKLIHFSSEKNETGKIEYGDAVISDAIRASMSIPGAFVPHAIYQKSPSGERQKLGELNLADGGMINNLPDRVFDRECFIRNGGSQKPEFNKRVVAFSLYSPQSELPKVTEVNNLWELMKGVVGVYFHAEGLLRDLNPYYKKRIIDIDNKGVGTLDFNLTIDKINMLIKSGRIATKIFFKDKKTDLDNKPQKERRIGLKNAPLLFGQDEVLKTLHRELVPAEDWAKDRKTELCVLYAPDGRGKSDLARKFAHTYREEFCTVYWIDAGTPETLCSAYYDIAEELECMPKGAASVEAVIKAVNQVLEQSPETKPWLIVFNNARGAVDLPRKGGNVLVTTSQGQEWPNHQVKVEPLQARDAQQLVLRISGTQDRTGAKDLVGKVGVFPFPLVLASVYLKQTEQSPHQYLSNYEQAASRIWFKGSKQETKALEQSLICLLDVLRERDALAYETLQFCLAFSSANLPTRWIESWLAQAKNVALSEVRSKMKAIVKTLSDYRLISSTSKSTLISMNPLLHRRLCARPSQQANALAMTLLANDPEKDVTWLSHAARGLKLNATPEEKGKVHLRMGELKLKRGDKQGAATHHQQALQGVTEAYGNNSIEFAKALYRLSALKPDQAVANLQTAAGIAEQQGEDLLCADCYLKLGGLRNSLQDFQRALIKYDDLGEDPKIATTLCRLGALLVSVNKPAAKTYFARALNLVKENFSEDDPLHVDCVIGLAKVEENYPKQERMATQALNLLQQHPKRTQDLQEMKTLQKNAKWYRLRGEGQTCLQQQKYSQAIKSYSEALKLKANNMVRAELAQCYEERGNKRNNKEDWARSEDLYRKVGNQQKAQEMSKKQGGCVIS